MVEAKTTMECFTSALSRWMNVVTLNLPMETRVSGHLGISGGKSPKLAQNPLPCHITPPSPHHLYLIHIINGLYCFKGRII